MQITLEGKAKEYVEHMVRVGCHPSADAVVDSLLREEGKKLAALRANVQTALDEGGEVSEEEVNEYLDAIVEELKQEGLE